MHCLIRVVISCFCFHAFSMIVAVEVNNKSSYSLRESQPECTHTYICSSRYPFSLNQIRYIMEMYIHTILIMIAVE